MKKLSLFLLLLASFIIISCDEDPCDDGYTQVDGVCIPDFLVGLGNKQNFKLGNTFYHPELGLIKYEKGKWLNENNSIISNFNE